MRTDSSLITCHSNTNRLDEGASSSCEQIGSKYVLDALHKMSLYKYATHVQYQRNKYSYNDNFMICTYDGNMSLADIFQLSPPSSMRPPGVYEPAPIGVSEPEKREGKREGG